MTDRDGGGTSPEPEGERPSVPRPFSKTPTFTAHNADRYQRRQLITNVQELTGRTLICYIDTSEEGISRDDILGFGDLLHNVMSHQPLDLLLHTGGGDIDATEKIVKVVRSVAGNAEFRIVVPDMAKSAGTLMTFGADQVLMSDTSELGPIDPQIPHVGASGELRRLSVLTYIKTYEEWKDALDANGNDVTACIMMSKLDPATLRHYRFVADRARNLAENLLKQGMFRLVPGNYTQIPADFMNLDKFSTHGQVIDAQDALRIGLNIEVLDRRSELWDAIWTLYTHQRMALGANSKLFESEYVCLPM